MTSRPELDGPPRRPVRSAAAVPHPAPPRARTMLRRHRDAVALEWDGVGMPYLPVSLAHWHHRRARWLSTAWLGRPALLITQQPRRWSVAHELGPGVEVRPLRAAYLLTPVTCCDPELVAEVAGSEDFDRGLLRLAEPPGGRHGLPDADAVLRASIGMTSEPVESFVVECDGRLVLWTRPGRPVPTESVEGPPMSDEDVYGP